MITLEDLDKLEKALDLLYDIDERSFKKVGLEEFEDIRNKLGDISNAIKKLVNEFEKEKLEKWNQSVAQ